MKSKTALVTGANGFLGRHVSRNLSESGWNVFGLGHGTWTSKEANSWGVAEWLSSDVTLDALQDMNVRPQVIVHCAGSGSVSDSLTRPLDDFSRTTLTLAAVLEYARTHVPDAVVVYPSSAAVYGNAVSLPIEERTPLLPESPYGVHKIIAEQLCSSYARNFNIATVVIRFFSIYGEGLKKQLIWDACKKIYSGDFNFFGTGDETRDWLHVADAANLIRTAIAHAAPECPIVNGASGRATPVSEILKELFLNIAPHHAPSFSRQEKPGDPKHFQGDVSAALKWGWSPSIGINEGLHQYVKWFKGEVV